MEDARPPSPQSAGRTPGATRKGIETRARIIRGALEALENGGMEALTTRKIAASAGGGESCGRPHCTTVPATAKAASP